MSKLTYTIEEAAKELHVGRSRMFELLRSGELESTKFGRRRVIPVESVVALLARRLREEKSGRAANA